MVQVTALQAQVSAVQAELDELNRLFQAKYDAYCLRMRAIYISGNYNLLTALLNLLPIDGFDGGRILYALLAWLAGPRLAAFLSSAASLLCVLFLYFSGIFLFFLANSGPQLLLFSLLLLLAEAKRRPGLFSS